MVRRDGRRAALQLLYALDASELWDDFEAQRRLFFAHLVEEELSVEARELADTLCAEVVRRRAGLDRQIEEASTNWRLERMSRIDRSILRLATAELVGGMGTPPAVVLDEAIELAKEFGTSESASFVNGVLNRLAGQLAGQTR